MSSQFTVRFAATDHPYGRPKYIECFPPIYEVIDESKEIVTETF
jgi:hypothetical protein